ncbi:MAG: putative PEP-binding protein [Nostocaceae cyanobacterium]|nr:putative PEP-binding protein [Nostocaceae cyanobacterium]
MDTLYWFDQIKPQHRNLVGEKAFNLSRLKHLGYPLVPGFVISAQALRQFLDSLNGSEPLVADLPHSSLHLDVDNWRQLQQVATRVRQEIISASVPPEWVSAIYNAAQGWQAPYLMLRPSLSVSNSTIKLSNTSGLMAAHICECQPERIALSLKQTWSQLFSAKSLMYWQRMDINLQAVHLAVLVQPLQNPLASGTLHARTTGLEIQSTWGLGVAITQGEVLPDTYQVKWETGEVRSRHLGSKMLAYGLANEEKAGFQAVTTATGSSYGNCLQQYLSDLNLQQQYALTPEHLQQVIQLGIRLAGDVGKNFTLEWVICPSTATKLTQVTITQVITPQFLTNHTQELKGLAAAAGKVQAKAYTIPYGEQNLDQIPPGVILVAPAIAPDWLTQLQQVAGIVTEKGGLTSHAAILARELGIPAVVNVSRATTLIQSEALLLLDGYRGEIHLLGNQEVHRNREPVMGENGQHSFSPQHQPTPVKQSTLPIIATQLLVNLSQPQLIEQVQSLPVDGVGLLRSELMAIALLEGQHPHSWIEQGRSDQLLERWSDTVLQFVRGFAPRPVFYRSLDWRSQELSSLKHTPADSPLSHQQQGLSILGERGTFSYFTNPAVFDLELAALVAVQQSGYHNFHLLLPFVRSLEEFRFCYQRIQTAGLTQIPQFQIWIMAEVPSVLFLLPDYIKAGVQGISIGTNDLTQLLLGVDREQGELGAYFNQRHPAVTGAIAQLIRMANHGGIPCSICGQAPTIYPEIIQDLVEWGISSISVDPEAVERTYNAIARAEQRLILQAARRQFHPSPPNHPYGG